MNHHDLPDVGTPIYEELIDELIASQASVSDTSPQPDNYTRAAHWPSEKDDRDRVHGILPPDLRH